MLVVAVVGIAWYVRAVRRRAARGHRWPGRRTVPFVAGMAAVGAAAFVPDGSFVGHTVEHLLLGMVAPLLVALGAPVTLALQTAGPASRAALRKAVHSRPAALVAHPVVGWLLFGGTVVVASFTPLLEAADRHPLVHVWLHLHLGIVGALFLWPLVGIDPTPARLPHGARLLAALAAVPFHAFVGIALLATDAPIVPDTYPSLADQHRAAGVLWASGELFTVAIVGVVFAQWLAADRREAARLDRAGRPGPA